MRTEMNEKLLWDYIDGLLDPSQIKEVEEKLIHDASFSSLYNELRRMEEALVVLEKTDDINFDIITPTLQKIPSRVPKQNYNISLKPVFIFYLFISIFTYILLQTQYIQGNYNYTLTNFFSNISIIDQAFSWMPNLSISGSSMVLLIALPILFALDGWISKKQKLFYSF